MQPLLNAGYKARCSKNPKNNLLRIYRQSVCELNKIKLGATKQTSFFEKQTLAECVLYFLFLMKKQSLSIV